jgi:hypothetical protein
VEVVIREEFVLDSAGAGRVAPDGVEVQHPVEGAAGAGPGVDRLACALTVLMAFLAAISATVDGWWTGGRTPGDTQDHV